MTKLGLVLGSGGARGYAHVGVLKAIEEKGLEIDVITGSSIGALVGVLYSHYQSTDKLEEILLDSYWREMAGLVRPSKGGVISSEKAQEFLKEFVGDTDLEDLPHDVGVVATDFKSSESVHIRKGKAFKALQASVAFPFFMEPFQEEGRVLWDGGLSNQVPIDLAREMGADRIIGVSLLNRADNGRSYENMNPYSLGVKAINTVQHNTTKMALREADFVIEPPVEATVFLGVGTLVKRDRGKKMIENGYQRAKEVLSNIEK